MKTYRIQRLRPASAPDHVIADVLLNPAAEDGTLAYPLPHLEHHSPDGYEFGYGGSGPADLARSIVGDLLGTEEPEPQDYQKVKWAHIASLPLNDDGPHEIPETELWETLPDRIVFRIPER